ncbi:MAG: signal recognition particle-docking protein FtsY [Actinomycetota bacterium]
METAIVVLIVIAVVLVVAGVGFVATRRRGDAELQAGAAADRAAAAGETGGVGTLERPTVGDATAVVDEAVDQTLDEAPAVVEPEVIVTPSFFERLGKARSAFTGYLGGLVGLSKVDDEAWEELEEALIRADVGVKTAMGLIEDVRDRAAEAGAEDGAAVMELLKGRMHEELAGKDRSLSIAEGETNVWLVVGVNGVGKTTTIGKLGKRLADEGHRPLMAAGDTFRAAAAEQLTTWAERSGAEIVRGNEGGDPSSVIFDGVQAAAARGCDVVLADTAGRLHNKSNLMDELSKVRRVAAKEPGHVSEVLLVIDATTGQNGMSQAQVFTEAVDVTGVVLTKLDGSAKGGIVFAVESELGIPVKLVGLGEGVGDLVDFEPGEFVDALFE